MISLINLREIGVKATVLASSLALVACGGGGGYYGDDKPSTGTGGGSTDGDGNNSTTDTKKVVESLSLGLQNAEAKPIDVAYDNSKVLVSIQALNSDKGGVAAKPISLTITDSEKLGVTSKTSQVSTGDDGFAVFELNIPTLTASSGKVLLTATVDGTTIKQVYTLNIKKTSTIQSEYNLNIQQHVTLDLPNGSTTITAQVTDKNGGIKSNQDVSLALPVEMQGKFSISNGSSIKTDASGKATFTITANSDLKVEDIKELVTKSLNLNFKLVDEFKAERQGAASITFKDISQVVKTLGIAIEDAPLVAQSGSTKVTVIAKNSAGELLANKKVKLAFTDSSSVYGVSIEQTEVTTDAKGFAVFTLKSASQYPIALSQQGVNLKATFVDSADIFATTIVKVTTADTSASDQLALQRLEIASSYKVNAKNDTVEIKVKGINNKGEAATKGKVKLTLNAEAGSNGVTFVGGDKTSNAEQVFDKDGYVTYTVKTNANTVDAVEALVKAGITATFTTDNNVTNSIKITVENEAKSEEALSYLTIDPINSAFDYMKNQKIEVKVKAVGVKGSALKGETVNLAFANQYSVADLQALGLSLDGAADKPTSADGYVTFTYNYIASGSAAQKALVENGILLVAKSASGTGAASTLNLNFKAPTAQGDVDLDYLTVDLPGSLSLKTGVEETITVTVKATGTDEKVRAGQKVTIGLNEAALSNGVSLVSVTSPNTDDKGLATFTLKVKANNASELTNLVTNGLTVAVKGIRADGSAYTVTRKVDIAQPAVIIPDLAALNLSYDVQTVSVLGGEVQVKVIAKDENGKIIPNTPVAIALSSLAGSRVSLSESAVTTNSKGEATFKIKVAEGIYDPSLIKNGITFAVVGTNLNNGDRIQQTGTIQVVVPANALNPRLTSDSKTVQANDKVKIYASVKDEAGAFTAGTPMRLALNAEAVAAGVTLSAESILVSSTGNVSVDLNVPNGLTTAQLSKIVVIGSIHNPNGAEIRTTLEFEVQDATNPNHLAIQTNKISLNSQGDTALITVKLLDSNEGAVANQVVSIRIDDPRNSTTIQGVSQAITNQFGEATFTVNMANVDIANNSDPIIITATNVSANGAFAAPQPLSLNVHSPTILAPLLDLKLKGSKDKLNVRGDAIDISVLVTDTNGSSQPDKAVTLSIPNYEKNGAYIRGASTLTSDENGWVKFTVVVDESLRAADYSAADFIKDALSILATVKDENGTVRSVPIGIDVVPSQAPLPIGAIAVNVNPIEIKSTSNGIYYNLEGSVQVVDIDGKPIANKDIVLDTRPTSYGLGKIFYAIKQNPWQIVQKPVLDANGDPTFTPSGTPITKDELELKGEYPFDSFKGWIKANEYYYQLLGSMPAQTPSENTVKSCPVTSTTTVNGQTLRVVRFIGSDANNPSTASYRTDSYGRFDFQIEYPKANAQWLNVEIGATSKFGQDTLRGTINTTLPALKTDYSTDGTYGPNLSSPYGVNINTQCQ